MDAFTVRGRGGWNCGGVLKGAGEPFVVLCSTEAVAEYV